MKLIIKTPKPRNPLALVARQRKAGAHDAHLTARAVRRAEKQSLQAMVKNRKGEYEL